MTESAQTIMMVHVHPADAPRFIVSLEPSNDALLQALACGQLWPGGPALTVADPVLWHACGTTCRARRRSVEVRTTRAQQPPHIRET